jgi:hypothetical protein
MARYDYGLRGPEETIDPRFRERRIRYGAEFYDRRRRYPSMNRITAAYNRDYVREDEYGMRFNPNPYGGEWRGQIMGEASYRPPYITRGGTWTSRGALDPLRYDYPDYGPEYGGRYPDEL